MTNDEPAGRALGGVARAEALSPERRSEIAKAGGQARWAKARAAPKTSDAGAPPESGAESVAAGTQVLIFPCGSLQPPDRKRLEACGIVAIECPDPRAVVQLARAPLAQTAVTGDALIVAAVRALASQDPDAWGPLKTFPVFQFVRHLAALVKEPPP